MVEWICRGTRKRVPPPKKAFRITESMRGGCRNPFNFHNCNHDNIFIAAVDRVGSLTSNRINFFVWETCAWWWAQSIVSSPCSTALGFTTDDAGEGWARAACQVERRVFLCGKRSTWCWHDHFYSRCSSRFARGSEIAVAPATQFVSSVPPQRILGSGSNRGSEPNIDIINQSRRLNWKILKSCAAH